MILAAIIFPGMAWLLPAVAIVAAAIAALAWSYRRGAAAGIRAACALLKLTAVAALAFCLLEPLLSRQRAKPGANFLTVVVDNSQGLQIHDAGAARSRGEMLRDALDPAAAPWLGTLGTHFQLRRYAFDARLQEVRAFSALDFSGRASAIATSLRSLADRYKDRPLAGILLFTDGNATDVAGGLPDLEGLPPVYPVVVGKADALRDVALERVTVAQSAFEDAPVTAQVDVAAHGLGTEPLLVRVADASGTTVAEQGIAARPDGSPANLRFHWKPAKPGISFFGVGAGTASEMRGTIPATNTTEATLANNRRVVVVDRGRGPHRILYVAGRPNWEFKFLNRAAQGDDQLEVVGLIR
ncbi:MAG: hypothetical protein DVB31_12155, partial [Verrucomicrobia bacterium]